MASKDFFQEGPKLANTFSTDPLLSRILSFYAGPAFNSEWQKKLKELGELAAGEMLPLAEQAERETPKHIPYDPWGRRIDRLEVSPAWTAMQDLAAELGIVATGYERKEGASSRVLQMALLYLYHPSSAIFSCPLAMTDGAARALEIYGDKPEMAEAFKHLISRSPKDFWTSGQWMTEKSGGSDVGLSQTLAKKVEDQYLLYGTKWFTSATTSPMTLTLARPENADEGGKGLSLFFVKVHDDKGALRNIKILRLKDKLGTKALPTAELELRGTPALLVGGEGQGVKKISTLFNITRIYNSVCSISSMQRGLALAQDYSAKRFAFGRHLHEHSLHLNTLADLWVEKAAGTLLVFRTAQLWGKDECKDASPDESALLRILTTLSKLYTGKKAVSTASEVLEVFGGAGYIEDTGLPRLLRDSQVFPIWEGTTNVLSLDVLRALMKDSPFAVFDSDIRKRLQSIPGHITNAFVKNSLEELDQIGAWLKKNNTNNELLCTNARGLALAMAQVYIKSLFLEFSGQSQNAWDGEMALRYLERPAWRPLEAPQMIGLPELFKKFDN